MALRRRVLCLHFLAVLLALVPKSLGDLQRPSHVKCQQQTEHPRADSPGTSEMVLEISGCINIDLNDPTLIAQKQEARSENVSFVFSTSPTKSMICVGSIDLVTSSKQRFSLEIGVTQESNGLVQLEICRGPGISNCDTVQIGLLVSDHQGNSDISAPIVQATLVTRNESMTYYTANVDLCSSKKKSLQRAARMSREIGDNLLDRDELMTTGEEDLEAAAAAAADQAQDHSSDRGDDLEKRKWRDSGVSWMKRNPNYYSSSSDSSEDENEAKIAAAAAAYKRGAKWDKGALMSWMKRKWAKNGMGWIKRRDEEKRKWKNSNMNWVKK